MAHNRPVESVSGQRDWAWNRWRAGRQSSASGDDAAAALASPDRAARHSARYRRRGGADRSDVRALETELERTERRLQAVITRYERLLHEKNRQLNEGTDAEPGSRGLLAAASNVVRRLTPR